jgi:hypothetical protein
MEGEQLESAMAQTMGFRIGHRTVYKQLNSRSGNEANVTGCLQMNSGRMIGSGLVWQFESKYVRQLLDGGK